VDTWVWPASNMVEVAALGVVAVGADLRLRMRRTAASHWQMVGILMVLAGAFVRLLARAGEAPVFFGAALPPSTLLELWVLAGSLGGCGWIAFAWGYLRSAAEDAA
jgi:hypothetical protein